MNNDRKYSVHNCEGRLHSVAQNPSVFCSFHSSIASNSFSALVKFVPQPLLISSGHRLMQAIESSQCIDQRICIQSICNFNVCGPDWQTRENTSISFDSTSSLLYFYEAKKVHSDLSEWRFAWGNPVFKQLCHKLLSCGGPPFIGNQHTFTIRALMQCVPLQPKTFLSETITKIPGLYGPHFCGYAG